MCLLKKAKQPINKEKAYKNIANAWRLNREELAILLLLAKWRIEEAQKRNLALNFVVKEASLVQIAKAVLTHFFAVRIYAPK